MSRVVIFVDAQNLERTASHHYDEGAVDFAELLDVLVDGRDLIRPYCFDSTPPPDDEDAKADFYRFLRRELGFRVVSETLQTDGPPKEKGVDIALATELLTQAAADAFGVAVLVSGDGDVVHAVREVQDRRRVVEVASFGGATSDSLHDFADEFHALGDVDDRIRRR